MAAAMLMLPGVDGIAKALSASHSPLFVAFGRYFVAALVAVPWAAMRHRGNPFPAESWGAHGLRTLCLVSAMTLYFLAIQTVPLATAISAFFIGPVLAALLARVVLKERLSRAKLVSLGLGFAGAMVILQPGGTIAPGLLLAFASGLCFALYMIATRKAALTSDPLKTLAFQCAFGALLLLPFGLATFQLPAPEHLPLFIGMGVISAVAHNLSIQAFRLTDASTLAPLVYLELVAATAIGLVWFGEVPGLATVVGAGLIVVAGLVVVRG